MKPGISPLSHSATRARIQFFFVSHLGCKITHISIISYIIPSCAFQALQPSNLTLTEEGGGIEILATVLYVLWQFETMNLKISDGGLDAFTIWKVRKAQGFWGFGFRVREQLRDSSNVVFVRGIIGLAGGVSEDVLIWMTWWFGTHTVKPSDSSSNDAHPFRHGPLLYIRVGFMICMPPLQEFYTYQIPCWTKYRPRLALP